MGIAYKFDTSTSAPFDGRQAVPPDQFAKNSAMLEAVVTGAARSKPRLKVMAVFIDAEAQCSAGDSITVSNEVDGPAESASQVVTAVQPARNLTPHEENVARIRAVFARQREIKFDRQDRPATVQPPSSGQTVVHLPVRKDDLIVINGERAPDVCNMAYGRSVKPQWLRALFKSSADQLVNHRRDLFDRLPKALLDRGIEDRNDQLAVKIQRNADGTIGAEIMEKILAACAVKGFAKVQFGDQALASQANRQLAAMSAVADITGEGFVYGEMSASAEPGIQPSRNMGFGARLRMLLDRSLPVLKAA